MRVMDASEVTIPAQMELPEVVARAVVGVVHPVPAYRYGLTSGLSEVGFVVRSAASIAELDEGWDACLLMIGSARECEALTSLHHSGAIVALLADPAPAHYQMALRCGASGAVAQSAPIHEIVRVLDASLGGMALLPVELVRALTGGPVPTPEALQLSGPLVGWLRALSQGMSIAAIARTAGYSERQMYRQMQRLYRRIGARNRREAIAIATRWGLDLAEA